MYKKRITHDILERYLQGNCTPDEKALVEDWYLQLDRHFDSNQQKVPIFDKEIIFDKIKSELGIAEVDSSMHEKKSAKIIKYSLSVAASVLVIAIAGYSLLFSKESVQSTKQIASNQLAETKVFENSTASIIKVTLPDGSSVWLNPRSVLKYSKLPEALNREIDFSGEAFFDVARDVNHPFVIHSGLMTTTVLGTSFNVMAIPNSKKFKVSVVSGSVKVSVNDAKEAIKTVLLKPNEQASFLMNSKELTYAAISPTELKANFWKPVTLNFEDADMAQIAAELEKAFKITVVFEKPTISKCKLKVDFENQKLPEILSFIEKLLDVKCHLNDQNILNIIGTGCN